MLGAVLLKVKGIVAASGGSVPAKGGVVRVDGGHRRGARHIEAGGGKANLNVVDVNRAVVT